MSISPSMTVLMAALDEMQASQIEHLDVREKTSVTDYMVVCTGRSSRHVKAIAETVLEKMKAAGFPAYSSQGLEQGDWALLDFGDIVLHIMQQEARDFYNLEGLWQSTKLQRD